MNESDMDTIERFERLIELPSPTRAATPPPIPSDAMAAVAKANRLAKSVSNELPLEWPQNPWVSRPVLAFAILSVVGIAGSLGYYIFSEGQAVLEKSQHRTAEITDSVGTEAAAPLRESVDRAPLPPPIPPTAPIRMGQWIPDPTSQGQGQPTPEYARPQAIAAGPAPTAPAPALAPAPAPLTLAQTAPQLNTQRITISAAAPVPAPLPASAPAPAPVSAQIQEQVPAPVQAQAAPAPKVLVGPQAPRVADPKAIEPSLADDLPEGTQQPVPLVVRVRTKEARFHSGPGVQYPIIAVARAETRYAVADWSDRWFKVAIRLPSGTTMGWIRNDQVLITPGGNSEKLPAYPDSASNSASSDEIE